MYYKVHVQRNKLQCTNTILYKDNVKTAEIVINIVCSWHNTKSEIVPSSQCTKIKHLVRQTHEDIF